VVEGEASTGVDGVDGFSGGELYLFDEVFVGGLGETFAFFLVEVDVVYPERSIEGGFGYPGEGRASAVGVDGEVLELSKFKSDADFVVLEGNERDAEAIVSAVEELEGYVEYIGGLGLVKGGDVGYVTNHAGVATFLAYFVGEFVPDVEPVTVLFVNLGAANFEVVVVNEGVSYAGYPGPFVAGTSITGTKGGAEVHFGYYVGIAS